jgi:predicted nuclease with TOPRIM domain
MSEDLAKTFPQSDSQKLTLVLSTVQTVAVRFDNFEQTVKLRFYDLSANVTQLQDGQRRLEGRLERVEVQLHGVDGRLYRLEEGQQSLRSEVRALRKSVDHRFLILSGTVLSRYSKLEERVTQLELNSPPPNTQT